MSSPSNNLKELNDWLISSDHQHNCAAYREGLLCCMDVGHENRPLILNLILDTILAKPEMQNEVAHLYGSQEQLNIDDEGDEFENDLAIARNAFRADLRAMLEGMKA